MQRTLPFACLLVLVFTAPAALAENTVQQPMGGIAGNHPYFYRGKAGQDYAARVGSGFRQIGFQRIRIISNNSGHYVNCGWPGYYWNRYGYGYGYRDYYREPAYVYFQPAVAEPPARPVRVVTQIQPRVPAEPWAMLAGGYYSEAVGAFAMKAQQDEPGANVGYALASAFKGDHGQAAWAMRKALQSGELAAAIKQMTPLRQRLRELANGYESNSASVTWQSDRWLLAASTHLLRGDKIAARKALEQLESVDAHEEGAATLRQLITGR